MTKTQGVALFQPGDHVTWNPDLFRHLRPENQGDLGPFVVERVEPVPERPCTCDMLNLDQSHEDACQYSSAKSAGHPQYVTVSINGAKHLFSGAYFMKA